jgi:alginate O-acetyltransferase complex protein AlgI
MSIIFLLVLVMGVSGLWHGNTLSFGLWGIIHGLALVFERFVLNKVLLNTKSVTFKKYWIIINFIYCLGIVTFTWILFREQNIYFALLFLRSLFCGEWCFLNLIKIFINNPILCYSIFIIVTMHYFAFLRQKRGIKRLSFNNRLFLCLFCTFNCIYLYGTGSSFIYFRF